LLLCYADADANPDGYDSGPYTYTYAYGYDSGPYADPYTNTEGD